MVVPDSLSDESFEMIRSVERRGVFDNLSILRIGDLGNYSTGSKKSKTGIELRAPEPFLLVNLLRHPKVCDP